MDTYVREALRLTTNYVSVRSIAIVIRDRAGNTATGTSTCVQVGEHLLLATAGHVIEDVNEDRIELLPAGELSSAKIPFIARSCSPARSAPTTDVAWIQIDPAVARANRLRFLGLDDLFPHQGYDRERPFLIHGYPHQSAILTPASADVESTVAFTMMAESGELPWQPQDYELELEYPPRDSDDKPLAVAPHAHGISGGGIWWHPRHDEALVFSPERLRLVAVSTKWDQAASVLVGTKIEHWLKLVVQDFPDTRAEIDQVLGT